MFGKTVEIDGKWYGVAGGRGYFAEYDGYVVTLAITAETVKRLSDLGCDETDITQAVERAALAEIHRVEREGRSPGENLIWLDTDRVERPHAIEFNSRGGIMTLQTMGHGLWEISIPWDVAIEGWKQQTGRDHSDEGDLRGWIDDNSVRFADMIAHRASGMPTNTPDDARVLATRLGTRR